MKAVPLVLLLSISLLALAACGGSSTSTGGATLESGEAESTKGSAGTGTNKEEWVKAAERVCAGTAQDFRRLEAEGRQLSKEPEDPHLADRLADLFEAEARIENEMSAELRALAPPTGEEDTVSAMLSAAEAVPGYSQQLAQQVRHGDVRDHELLYHQRHQVTFVQSKLRSYGLRRCSESFR